MESDLLFSLVTKQDWKKHSGSGQLNTPDLIEKGYIISYEGNSITNAANAGFEEETDLFLLVIDPLRLQHPVKREKTDLGEEIRIFGAVSIDAVIDRVQIRRNKKGLFDISIKHFD